MRTVAIVLEEGFEELDFTVAATRLIAAGYRFDLIGSHAGQRVAGAHDAVQPTLATDAEGLYPADYAGLVIPGGQAPGALRRDSAMVDFVRGFVSTGRPVAAIGRGARLLIEAEVVRGRSLTAWPGMRTDLVNAGAAWVDDGVVEDGNLVTAQGRAEVARCCERFMRRLAA
ncbi:MAG: DJ-1/PfpI family protein [Gammaproteobacteria bacterium]|uniref:DJ-1/PfpI family protein n=1 Tax=Oceanibaculum nanhaiense TaxID=1909734 RepID=UPI0032ED5591